MTSEARVLWHAERIYLSGESLVCHGWLAHQDAGIASVDLHLLDASGGLLARHRLEYGLASPDAAEQNPSLLNASHSGFQYFGATTGHLARRARLVATTEGGEAITLPPFNLERISTNPIERMFKTYLHLGKRVLAYVRDGRWKDLRQASRRYLESAPKKIPNIYEHLTQLVQGPGHAKWALILDHTMGGGANQFRARLENELLESSTSILLLTYRVTTLQFVVIVNTGDGESRYAVDPVPFFEALAGMRRFERVYLNNIVSFAQPLVVLRSLKEFCEKTGVPLTVYGHDYHPLCPSFTLLDHTGHYCDLPSTTQCETCLPSFDSGFVSLFVERDIHAWRATWQQLLGIADEVVFFSDDTRNKFIRIYPELRAEATPVRPHSLDDFSDAPVVEVDLQKPLKIGVVGLISLHKGAAVVHDLARQIRDAMGEERIVVLGTIEGRPDSQIVEVTGAFERKDLPGLLRKHGVNMIAFTSIWPETFSYVVHELMATGIPIVCFDLGAPAEKLRSYDKALIVPLDDAPQLLARMRQFHEALKTQAVAMS